MKLKFQCISLVFVFFCFYGCKPKSAFQIEVEKWVGKEVQIPQKMEALTACKDSVDANHVKILTVIQGNCGACTISLAKWEELMKENTFSPSRVKYYFMIESEDDFYNFEFIQEQYDLMDYPFILDHDQKFFKQLSLSENESLQTLLLDNKNTVLGVGNPIYSEQVKKQYASLIADHLNVEPHNL